MPATAMAMDFFQMFVPDNVIQSMVTQTNMYAKKYQERFGSDEGWTNVTLAEMKAFLGYVTSTGVNRCESVLSIWSSGFFSNRSIAAQDEPGTVREDPQVLPRRSLPLQPRW